MSDPFFQKKRKRSAGVGAADAGPSRTRMRDRSAALGRKGQSAKRGRDEGSEGESGEEGDEGLDGMDTRHRYEDDIHESDEEQTETPAEARVRLARLYLDSLRDDDIDPDDIDAAEIDRQNISSRLQADAATHSSHVHNIVADRLDLPASPSAITPILACRGHRLSVTAAVLSANCASLWTASKDGSIIRWRLHDGKMMERVVKGGIIASKPAANTSNSSGAARRRARTQAAIKGNHAQNWLVPGAEEGHRDEVWSLSCSYDGQYLASAGKDRRICIWRTADDSTAFIKALGGHKDSITALRFRQGTHDLFSVSLDRTMKLFDVSQLSYIETFFGHQEEVADMDILRAELAVSAGSRDRTVRWWKVRDESQLVFRGGARSRVREILEGGDIADEDEEGKDAAQLIVEGSIDAVAMVDDHTFLSGGDSGTISLWSLAKKKPVFTVAAAHGFEYNETASSSSGKPMKKARWITSLACLPYGDLFASGSWDGHVRLWKLNAGLKSFSAVSQIPACGFVNALQLVSPSRAIIKQRGGQVIAPEQWQRKSGLKSERTSYEENVEAKANGLINGVGGRDPHTMIILVIALGQEHKRSRWQRIREAQNGTLVVPISLSS